MTPDGVEHRRLSISDADNMAPFPGRRDSLAGGLLLPGRSGLTCDFYRPSLRLLKRYSRGRARSAPLSGCNVTPPIANYHHGASIWSRGSKLHGSTTTRAMCLGVICQTNYLSWACNCSENRYSGNCVASCNVK